VKDLAQQSHYEVLELDPGCSAEDVEAAYRRAVSQLGPSALATYALTTSAETQALQRRLDEAFAVLNDRVARKAYDERLALLSHPAAASSSSSSSQTRSNGAGAGGERVVPGAPTIGPNQAHAAGERDGATAQHEAADGARPIHKTEADLPPDAPVTGEALRRVREARGLTLKDLAAKTKIGHWHLDNIEREKYSALPALVYLRGFLGSLARELKLDPVRVARSYLEQMAAKTHPPNRED
jgi:curved DNA-binding protein CbpA